MQGLYPGGGGMAGQSAAGVYAAGYGLEPSSFNMHCAPFEQNLSGVCPGDSAKAAGAKEQRDSDLAAESNFRIYPWMRSSGNAAHRAVPSGSGWGHSPAGAAFPANCPISRLECSRQEVGPGDTAPPPPATAPRAAPTPIFAWCSQDRSVSLADLSSPTPKRSKPPAGPPPFLSAF